MLPASFSSLCFWLPLSRSLFLAEACGLKPEAFRAAAADSPLEIMLAHSVAGLRWRGRERLCYNEQHNEGTGWQDCHVLDIRR